jgi:FecR protein
MKKSFMLKSTGLIVLMALSQGAMAKSVGTVTFSAGDVTIAHADKTVAKAEKNAELNAGDAIETKEGRVQLSMIDGGKISLQPNTIYKINKFEFTGNEDGSEYNFTELVKGGLRTISGLIGHKNRDHYQMKTAVATIGIRGTEYTANFNDNHLLMTTNHGSVDVCNEGGCLNAITGQTIEVSGIGGAPKPSKKAAKAAAAPPASSKAIFAAGDLINVAAIAPPTGPAASGSIIAYSGITNGSATYGTGLVDLANAPSGTNNNATLINGNIVHINDDLGYSFNAANTPAESGSDSNLGIYWSRYSNGFTVSDATGSSISGDYHSIYATHATTGTELIALQGLANTTMPSLITGTYNLAGKTSPTDLNGITGTLNSLTIIVNFGNQTITQYSLNATVGGVNYLAELAGAGPAAISAFTNSASGGVALIGSSSTGFGPTAVLTGSANGAFTGTQAQGMTTAYQLQNAAGTAGVSGVAALVR